MFTHLYIWFYVFSLSLNSPSVSYVLLDFVFVVIVMINVLFLFLYFFLFFYEQQQQPHSAFCSTKLKLERKRRTTNIIRIIITNWLSPPLNKFFLNIFSLKTIKIDLNMFFFIDIIKVKSERCFFIYILFLDFFQG